EASRDEIVRILGVPRESIEVIHLACDGDRARPTPETELRGRYALQGVEHVFLCVSAYRPHKNQALLIRALPALGDTALVLVGPSAQSGGTLEQLGREPSVRDSARL